MRNNKYLFLITLSFFALGFVNIYFALFGFACMLLPLILLFRDKRKTWCQGYCPRASLFKTCGTFSAKRSYKMPAFFIKGKMKWVMLAYFVIALLIIIISTIKVANGSTNPMNFLRFLSVVPITIEMPQVVAIANLAPWVKHLSYSFYSLMMTTTFLGFILALVYKPRTWCTICPIATVSELYIKGTGK